MGWSVLHAHADRSAASLRKNLEPCGEEGMFSILFAHEKQLTRYQNVLYCSLFIFATGSLLCGAAQVRFSY